MKQAERVERFMALMNFNENRNITYTELNAVMKEFDLTDNSDRINVALLRRYKDGKYGCVICKGGKFVRGLPCYVDFRTLTKACKDIAHYELPPVKAWKFRRFNGICEAYIQGMVTAKSCMVEWNEQEARR